MDFHGILYRSKVPWNSIELFPYSRVPWNSLFFPKKKFHGIPWNSMERFWSSMEFHGTWSIWYLKIIFLNIVVGIWLMIRCYLVKISHKRYIWHWFQYRNSYFEHPVSAKMAQGQRKCRAVLSILQTSTVVPLQFGNGWVMLSHTL